MKTKLFLFTLLVSLFSYSQTQIGDDINGEFEEDRSGHKVSLNSDGSIIVISTPSNDGNGSGSGHVRVYKYESNIWSQLGDDIDGEAEGDRSGKSVSLSSDGSIIAIGADFNDGNGNKSGHVRVYKYESNVWTQLGDDIDGEEEEDRSGISVSLSSDGSIIAIGAYLNNGNSNGSGHVRVYKYESNVWTQLGDDINGEASNDHLGYSVSLNSDGTIVAIGAELNDGNGDNSGHVRVYKYESSVWTQLGDDINGEVSHDKSGYSVSLSGEGNIIAIGTPYNEGNGYQSGHVRVYKYESNVWTQLGIDVDGEVEDDLSGISISLSSNGSILAIGAPGNSGNNYQSGHVRVYKYENNEWIQLGDDIDGEAEGDFSGFAVSLSSDASILAISAPFNDENGTNSGYVRVYDLSEILSIKEDNLFNFSLYPNPSKNQVIINLPSELIVKKIELFNSIGLLINTTQEKEINISTLSSGIYYVRVTTREGESVKKLVVE